MDLSNTIFCFKQYDFKGDFELNPSVLNAKQIRASVITKWLKMYNLREVQYLAGHRYISSTESYLQNDLEGLKEEVQQFHNIMGPIEHKYMLDRQLVLEHRSVIGK